MRVNKTKHATHFNSKNIVQVWLWLTVLWLVCLLTHLNGMSDPKIIYVFFLCTVAQFTGYIKRNRGYYYYYYYYILIIIITTPVCENLRWVVRQWQNAYWLGGEQLQTHLTFVTEEHLWKETLNLKVFSAGITHVICCWHKCLSHLGDYLEKQRVFPLFLELFDIYGEVLNASVTHFQILHIEYPS